MWQAGGGELLYYFYEKIFAILLILGCLTPNTYLKSNGHKPLGTPDYIVWNDNEIIFVEVKRKNEKLSPEQIEWGKFLIKNKIPYKVIRVVPKCQLN